MKKVLPICLVALVLVAILISIIVCYISNKTKEKLINPDIEISGEKLEVMDKKMIEDFLIKNPDLPQGSMENFVNGLTADVINAVMIMGDVKVNSTTEGILQASDSKSYIGLTKDEFEQYVIENSYYESNEEPQFICMLKVNDTSKVEDLKLNMFRYSDTRRWKNKAAERILIMSSGEYILFAMATSDSCDRLITAFEKVFEPARFGSVFDRVIDEGFDNNKVEI